MRRRHKLEVNSIHRVIPKNNLSTSQSWITVTTSCHWTKVDIEIVTISLYLEMPTCVGENLAWTGSWFICVGLTQKLKLIHRALGQPLRKNLNMSARAARIGYAFKLRLGPKSLFGNNFHCLDLCILLRKVRHRLPELEWRLKQPMLVTVPCLLHRLQSPYPTLYLTLMHEDSWSST